MRKSMRCGGDFFSLGGQKSTASVVALRGFVTGEREREREKEKRAMSRTSNKRPVMHHLKSRVRTYLRGGGARNALGALRRGALGEREEEKKNLSALRRGGVGECESETALFRPLHPLFNKQACNAMPPLPAALTLITPYLCHCWVV